MIKHNQKPKTQKPQIKPPGQRPIKTVDRTNQNITVSNPHYHMDFSDLVTTINELVSKNDTIFNKGSDKNIKRDPKRITKILKAVKDIWQQLPDLRLGQMLGNCIIDLDHLYYLEDKDLIDRLYGYYIRDLDKLKKV